MKISDSLLGEFEQELKTTRKVLERCPDEKFHWKPHQKSWEMGTLASHIVHMLFRGIKTSSHNSPSMLRL